MKIYAISKESKDLCRKFTAQAQAAGLLPRPERCEICGFDREMLAEEKAGKEIWGLSDKVEKCLLDSHHPNYGKPLEVWHLCKRCHKRLHKIQIENRIAILDLRMAKRLVLKNL